MTDDASGSAEDASTGTGQAGGMSEEAGAASGEATSAPGEPSTGDAETGSTAEKPGTGDEDAGSAAAEASEAFSLLGDETRMAVLEALVDVEHGPVRPAVRSFTELFEATGEETTAGFAYHLRQLRDVYVEKTDEGYRLTYAGLRVVREIAAGTFTARFDLDPVAVPDPCPFCEGDLAATGADNVLTVACTDCDRDVLSLPFPPGGHATHDREDLLTAFDRHHRHRVRQLREGSCPGCGGASDGAVQVDDGLAHASLACRACGYAIRCPVALTVLEHPAVVSLFHEHGEDVRDRAVWNVGPEWTETVLSTDPVCVRVGVHLGEDHLALFVGADCSVGHAERSTVDPAEVDGERSGDVAGEPTGDERGEPEGDASDPTAA